MNRNENDKNIKPPPRVTVFNCFPQPRFLFLESLRHYRGQGISDKYFFRCLTIDSRITKRFIYEVRSYPLQKNLTRNQEQGIIKG